MAPRSCLVALALVLPALLAGPPAVAGGGTSVECRREGVVRRIEVLRDPEPERACEVQYAEPGTEGAPHVAWFAARDRDFCHHRADTLIAMLARTGWVCDVMPKRTEADSPEAAAPQTRTGARLVVPRPR